MWILVVCAAATRRSRGLQGAKVDLGRRGLPVIWVGPFVCDGVEGSKLAALNPRVGGWKCAVSTCPGAVAVPPLRGYGCCQGDRRIGSAIPPCGLPVEGVGKGPHFSLV